MLWLRRMFRRSRAESDLDKELRFHVEQQIVDSIAEGMSAEEARRHAQQRFSSFGIVLSNDVTWFPWGVSAWRGDRRDRMRAFGMLGSVSIRLRLPAQTVDATPSDPLIRQHFPCATDPLAVLG